MKFVNAITLLLATGMQIMKADTATTEKALAEEFQRFPPVNIATMNGYDWAVIRKILYRGAELSGIKIKNAPTFFNGVVELTIAGPNYKDNYTIIFSDPIKKLTNAMLAAVSPFVESTQPIHIDVMPGNVNLRLSPATAAIEASNLKPAFHSGATILFPDNVPVLAPYIRPASQTSNR